MLSLGMHSSDCNESAKPTSNANHDRQQLERGVGLPSSTQDKPKVNRLDVEDRMVLEVIFVKERLKLKVN